MSKESMILLVSAECESACRDEPDLIERIKKAMAAAKNHWMAPDDDTKLKGALNAALKESAGADKDRLEKSIERMSEAAALLAALTSGIPIDYEALEAKNEAAKADEFESLKIMELWHAA